MTAKFQSKKCFYDFKNLNAVTNKYYDINVHWYELAYISHLYFFKIKQTLFCFVNLESIFHWVIFRSQLSKC